MFVINHFDREVAAKPPLTIPSDYEEADRHFSHLLLLEDLDENLDANPAIASLFQKALSTAIIAAYKKDSSDSSAHQFLMRVLYRINRLKLFWYDELRRYTNECSAYLSGVRNRIEKSWQEWELAQLNVANLQSIDVKQALLERVEIDLNPTPSINGQFFRERVTEAGYRRMVAIASLDGLIEASQLSRTLGGVGNRIQSMLTRLLMEEYGGGRLTRKHSSYFTQMLLALGMQTEPEAYFNLVPWQVLASINQSFLLSECKRYFLRYIGGLLYFEISVPAAFSNYRAAGVRLGLPPAATSYWDVHIKADVQHGRWMLEDVALPLAELYPTDAWEIVLGYDQQRQISDRAGAAVARSARQADRTDSKFFQKARCQ